MASDTTNRYEMYSAHRNDRDCDSPGQFRSLLRNSSRLQPSNNKNVLKNQNQADKSHREIYRLTTYYIFHDETTLDPLLAAAHGFFHTSSPFSIKCFSCHNKKSFENILCTEEELRKIHSPRCNFANGIASGNFPIQEFSPYDILPNVPGSFTNLLDNQVGLQHPCPSSSVASDLAAPSTSSSPSAIATSNFDHRGLPHNEHPRNGEHQILDSEPWMDVLESVGATTVSPPKQPKPADLKATFPCQSPSTPEMAMESSRVHTFINGSTLWKGESLFRATPKDFAEAGLYYLGEGDRMKCWYCNGGLKNWKKEDDPWKEHAKWYPRCEFVLQQKGPEYVHKVVSEFPNLKRPIINGETPHVHSNQRPQLGNYGHGSSSSSSHIPSGFFHESRGSSVSGQQGNSLEVIDPLVERTRREEIIARELRTSAFVPQLKAMGFAEDQIEVALKRQLELNNGVFKTLPDFLEAILTSPEPKPQLTNPKLPNAGNPHSSAHSSFSFSHTSSSHTPSSLSFSPHQRSSEEERSIIQSRMCRICQRAPSTMVFLPCGHLVSCVSCGKAVDHCPLCNTYIRERIRSYIS